MYHSAPRYTLTCRWNEAAKILGSEKCQEPEEVISASIIPDAATGNRWHCTLSLPLGNDQWTQSKEFRLGASATGIPLFVIKISTLYQYTSRYSES
jgi:hypothetical protein